VGRLVALDRDLEAVAFVQQRVPFDPEVLTGALLRVLLPLGEDLHVRLWLRGFNVQYILGREAFRLDFVSGDHGVSVVGIVVKSRSSVQICPVRGHD